MNCQISIRALKFSDGFIGIYFERSSRISKKMETNVAMMHMRPEQILMLIMAGKQ